MKTIGITGGVGCGKSKILEYISKTCNCRIILADDVGNKLKEPGEVCYNKLIDLLGEDIIDTDSLDKAIDKKKMAAAIFADESLLLKVNDIIHPAVTEYILKQKEIEKEKGNIDFFFIEAALLIECGYREYVDELWYIYADESKRIERLISSRGYSKSKIASIMASQLSEAQFRENCDYIIDNSGSLEETYKQVDKRIKLMKELS